MSIFSFLSGNDLAKPIDSFGNAVDKIFTSDDERLTRQEAIERLRQNPQKWQHELNLLNAQGNWFNSGWRPSLGWVTSISLFLYFVPQYIMGSYLWVMMCLHDNKLHEYPISATPVIELAMVLLGVYGTQRTIEKFRGVAKQ